MNSTANGPDLTAGAVDPRVCSAWALHILTIVFFLGIQTSRRTQEVGSALRGDCTNSLEQQRCRVLYFSAAAQLGRSV